VKIGILSLQGDVIEHFNATKRAAEELKPDALITEVREKKDFENLNALIIPGGESTTLMKLLQREDLIEEIKKIRNIFGTCAGAILLSKSHLDLMDIEVERNAYGSQLDSFSKKIHTSLGEIEGIFIRAPKIKSFGRNVSIFAKNRNEIVGVEQKKKENYYLAVTFHPELSGTKIHKYFIQKIEQK
jgi:5'-phosphate synthase pdxT subunit